MCETNVPQVPIILQGLPEAHGAVQSHPHHPAQCAELPEAEELAVVEAVHQGQATPPGHQCRGAEERDGRGDQEIE